jgi:hypothetical protein
MVEVVLDSNILADFLAQYFDLNTGNRGMGKFKAQDEITPALARKINTIIKEFVATDDPSSSGLVIASVLAFIELSRKFDPISKNRFQIENLYDFIQNHPEWFSIAPVDMDLVPFFIDVPAYVYVNGKTKPIEWTDAIHVATTFSRGDASSIATTDHKIKAIPSLSRRFAL